MSYTLLLIVYYVFTFRQLSILTSPPQRLSPLNINELYSYGTNMDAYDDR